MPFEPPPRRARLRPLRRPEGSIQLGVGPHSVRFEGLTDAEVRWLAALETRCVLRDALAGAALEGVDPARAEQVLDRLLAAGLLTPAPDAGALVAVVGSGALPALLTDVLRQGEDTAAVRVRPGGERETSADLAVVVGAGPLDPSAASAWLAADTPVLPVWSQPAQASIGPLLTPEGRPCLRCLELTRAGLDPGWPWLRAQLTGRAVSSPEPVDGEPALRLLAAGLVTSTVADHLAGRLREPDWSIEVALPGPTLERRHWRHHPECPACAPFVREGVANPDHEASSTDPEWPDTMAG